MLQTLFPVPEKVIKSAMTGIKKVIVPEMNMGQYRHEVERFAQPETEVIGINKMNTTLISPSEIVQKGGLL